MVFEQHVPNTKQTKMKRTTVVLLAICTLSVTGVMAQTTEDTRDVMTGGFKAGINNSNVWDEEGQDFEADPKNGFAGGVFFSIPLGRYLGIQPEILYSQKGFQAYGTAFGTEYSYIRTTNHIDVPVLLQFKPTSYITLVGGPNYSYMMSRTDVRKYGTFSSTEEETFSNNNLRKNTLGAVVGVDINVEHLVISPRVGWDFQTNNGDGTSSNPRYRNQWLQLTIGYRF